MSGDVSVVKPGPGEVLLGRASCGICGSDVLPQVRPRVQSGSRAGDARSRVLGHRRGGRTGCTQVSPGGRGGLGRDTGLRPLRDLPVRCDSVVSRSRGHRLSRDGGMAEYAVMPEQRLVPVPEGLDPAVAALGEPLSVAVHAVDIPGRSRARAADGGCRGRTLPGSVRDASRAREAEVLLTGVGQDSASRLPAAGCVGLGPRA